MLKLQVLFQLSFTATGSSLQEGLESDSSSLTEDMSIIYRLQASVTV